MLNKVYNLKFLFFMVYLIIFISNISIASNLGQPEVTGTKEVYIPIENSQLDLIFAQGYLKKYKVVKVSKLKLNQLAENRLYKNVEDILDDRIAYGVDDMPAYISNSDFNVDLTMSNVPVLDQLDNGACVVFAVTAAMDAIKNSGDYSSQQCLLELGKTFEQSKYDYEKLGSIRHVKNTCFDSGWDGQKFHCIIERIASHGIVAKEHCPHNYPNKEVFLSSDEYKSLSFDGQWSHDFVTKELLDPNDIAEIKQSLNNGKRVLISVALNITDSTYGGYPINNKKTGLIALPIDSSGLLRLWKKALNESESHAMIAVGYSDKHQVLKVRNSWGYDVGDNGDFYITYEYYKMFNIDAIEIDAKN